MRALISRLRARLPFGRRADASVVDAGPVLLLPPPSAWNRPTAPDGLAAERAAAEAERDSEEEIRAAARREVEALPLPEGLAAIPPAPDGKRHVFAERLLR